MAALSIWTSVAPAGAATPIAPVAGGLTALPATTTGRNLLSNAGFEEVDGALPGAWDATAGWAVDRQVSHSGSVSFRRSGGAATVSQAVALTKGVYTLSAWVKTDGLGEGAGSGLRLLLDSRSAGVNEWGASDVISGTGDWKRYEVGPVAITTDRTVRVRLESYNGARGTAWIDDVTLAEVVPPPVDVFMLYPNYRGMLFDDQLPAIALDVTVTPPAGTHAGYTVAATLSDERTGAIVAARTYPAAATLRATVPALAMRAGTPYVVKVSLLEAAGDAVVYTYPAFRVSKVPAAARAAMSIAVDDRNRIVVRGTPRFVLGAYDAAPMPGLTARDAERGLWSATGLKLNMYLNSWSGRADAAAVNSLMTSLQKRGVTYLHTGPCAGASAAALGESAAQAQDIGAHPARAGHHTIDECARVVPAAFTQYQRSKQLDGGGLTLATLTGGGADVARWREAADVLAMVVHPMYGPEPSAGYRHRAVAEAAQAARSALQNARPFMAVLPASALGAFGRAPRLPELRSHAYMAIVEGARGVWWSGPGEHARALQPVVDEIAALEPVLVADDAPDALTSNSQPSAIRTKVKVVGGTGYVFAYNATSEPVRAAFGWRTAPTRVTVHAESRAIAATGGGFSDRFEPYEAHVYVISSARMTERN